MDNINPSKIAAATTASASPNESPSALIVEVTTESFIAEVIDASQQCLVLVDFWAPWCEPCKQLTPVLEKLVGALGGAVKLAKMNIDEHPAVAQQMQVRSIPAVFAFKGGQPVDGFMGVLPESELKKFIDKHVDTAAASPIEALQAAAEAAIAANDVGQAAQAFSEILAHEPDNLMALTGLAQCYLKNGQNNQAREILAIAPETSNDPALAAARAALALADKVADAPAMPSDIGALETALAATPDDHQKRFDLALAYHAAGQKAAAMDALIDLLDRQRDWHENAAHKQLLEFFAAYGAQDDQATQMVADARRRLSSVLFS